MTIHRRLPIHVVAAKLRRGEKLFVLDYGRYEFEDGTRPGEGVVRSLRNADRLVETYPDGSRVGAILVLRTFAPGRVQRENAGGALYAPVDQFGVESGDTPSYDAAAVRARCDQLNGKRS